MNKEKCLDFAKNLILENRKTRGFPRLSEVFIAQPNMLPGLIYLLGDEYKYPFPEYSSWLLTHIAKRNSNILQPYLETLVDHLLNTKNESARRNVLGAICNLPLTDYEEGQFLNKLLEWISNPTTKPAIVMYSLEKLVQFCEKYPEIKTEVEAILNFLDASDLSPAIKVAKRKFLTGK
jgi:hypothetical protein